MGDQSFDEKEIRKQDEKTSEEKGVNEKWQRDPLSAIIWAFILIWLGVVLLANNLDLLDSLIDSVERLPLRTFDFPFEVPFVNFGVWSLFFLGAGLLVLAEVIIRLVIPAYRRPVLGTFIWSLVLFGIALGNWNLIWPIILIGIGVSVLLRGFFR